MLHMCLRHVVLSRDAPYPEMPDDNIPSQKYRDTGISRHFVTSSIVDNFSKNSTHRNIGKIYTLQAATQPNLYLQTIENAAIANASQLQTARRRAVPIRFNSSPVPSLKSLSLSVAVLERFYCWPVTLRCDLKLWPRDLDLWPLILNICSVPAVPWSNSVPNLSAIEQSALCYALG